MTTNSTHPSGRGILLMSIAMLTVPIVDGTAKYLSTEHSPLFIAWARYASASLFVLPLAFWLHGRAILPTEGRPVHLLRTIFLVSAMTLYFLALARIPIAQAVSAYFAGPVVAVALSVLVLREAMTRRKALSLALGFAGSLVVLRPTSDVDVGLLLAFGAGVFFALYLVTTRQASLGSDPIKVLTFQCVVGTLLLTPQAMATVSPPQTEMLWLFAVIGLFSVFSHMLTILAFRLADASTLSPLVYLELVGSAIIGFIVFTEIPATRTVLGAALIVGGGLVLTKRRKKV
ncbi:DMT family transporter [Aliiruegeria haliotis]|nr:DMT family transporter [Aliiruegeria haliotis]